MSSKEKRSVPPEAIELYNQFIHGEITRRDFISGANKLAVAGLTAGALVTALMPDYAAAQQVSKTDERIKASYITIPSPQGNGYVKGYFVRPFSADSRSETPAKLPGIIVVHENRGLNPHTEDVARRLALVNFNVFAPDVLTSVGGYPGDDFQGGQLFAKIDNAKKFEDIVASALWLKARPDSNGKRQLSSSFTSLVIYIAPCTEVLHGMQVETTSVFPEWVLNSIPQPYIVYGTTTWLNESISQLLPQRQPA